MYVIEAKNPISIQLIIALGIPIQSNSENTITLITPPLKEKDGLSHYIHDIYVKMNFENYSLGVDCQTQPEIYHIKLSGVYPGTSFSRLPKLKPWSTEEQSFIYHDCWTLLIKHHF